MTLDFAAMAVSALKVLVVGIVLGAGLPALYAFGIRMQSIGSGEVDGNGEGVRNTTYTVTGGRRGWNNDRTIYSVTGPKGGSYSLVEFDSGNKVLTDIANGRSVREYAAAPTTPPQRAEIEDERYGWAATLANFDRHVAELARAVEEFRARDRETTSAYSRAGRIRVASWAIAADTGQIARLESIGAQ